MICNDWNLPSPLVGLEGIFHLFLTRYSVQRVLIRVHFIRYLFVQHEFVAVCLDSLNVNTCIRVVALPNSITTFPPASICPSFVLFLFWIHFNLSSISRSGTYRVVTWWSMNKIQLLWYRKAATCPGWEREILAHLRAFQPKRYLARNKGIYINMISSCSLINKHSVNIFFHQLRWPRIPQHMSSAFSTSKRLLKWGI